MIKRESDGTIICGMCKRRFRFNPDYAHLKRDKGGGQSCTADPAGWVEGMGVCPSCYDKAHGGKGKVFEDLCRAFEVKS